MTLHAEKAAVADALYEVRGLTKRYGDRLVLDHLDFEVLRGECLVVLGRSGSGKSVTLRQLDGLEEPDEGSIVFDGTDIAHLPEKELYPLRRRVAMLFQGGALFDSMNVYDNIAFPLRERQQRAQKGSAEKDSEEEIAGKVKEKLGLVHLPGIEEKMPSDLSGGMKKRVALARSLALDPEVVLFDEPTTGLDPRTSASIGSLIRGIQSELGVTSVVVTHDIPLAEKVGDRLVFLSEGRFRFVGNWEEARAAEDAELQDFLAGREEEETDA